MSVNKTKIRIFHCAGLPIETSPHSTSYASYSLQSLIFPITTSSNSKIIKNYGTLKIGDAPQPRPPAPTWFEVFKLFLTILSQIVAIITAVIAEYKLIEQKKLEGGARAATHRSRK